jgi:hypothetical protein
MIKCWAVPFPTQDRSLALRVNSKVKHEEQSPGVLVTHSEQGFSLAEAAATKA